MIWLSGQATCDLIVTLDDATSEIYSAFLIEEEGTAPTFRALQEVFTVKGLPGAAAVPCREAHETCNHLTIGVCGVAQVSTSAPFSPRSMVLEMKQSTTVVFVNHEWAWKVMPTFSSMSDPGAIPTTFEPPVELGGNPIETT